MALRRLCRVLPCGYKCGGAWVVYVRCYYVDWQPRIIHEEEDFVVLDKPHGVTVSDGQATYISVCFPAACHHCC